MDMKKRLTLRLISWFRFMCSAEERQRLYPFRCEKSFTQKLWVLCSFDQKKFLAALINNMKENLYSVPL